MLKIICDLVYSPTPGIVLNPLKGSVQIGGGQDLLKQSITRFVDISEVVFSYPYIGLPSCIHFEFRSISLLVGPDIYRDFLLSALHSVTFIYFRFLRFSPSP